ncbi:hypothetical protein CY34DRAFT_452807 [Suillus luteus UH-Slu-Lm8-n1]|uniref:Uncharacterized protein n=1 Tax=Suillus luteus UH-Slu-Lm8-n1 TaxID=930992 RepID=A0A0D0AHE8_9AGAM|nr:hypothetical protein CY34DRAFT_452807 [Suillus luteus UH-Slu-Lm8-n1]
MDNGLLNLYIDFFMTRVGGGCIRRNSIGPGTDYKGNQGQTLDLYSVRLWLYLGPTMYDDSVGLSTTSQDSLALTIQPSAVGPQNKAPAEDHHGVVYITL